MAYPNYYGYTSPYGGGYASPMQPQPQPQQNNTSNVIWVQGEAGAKAYPLAPGTSVILMDSENDYFYIKSADASGMPQPLRKFVYKEELDNMPEIPSAAIPQFDPDQYITRSEFEKRLGELKRPRTEYKKGEHHAE